MSIQVAITFSASGYIKQNVIITKKGLTPAKLESLLNKSKAFTTIQEDGEVILISSKKEVIGKVINVDNNLEYDDFVVN